MPRFIKIAINTVCLIVVVIIAADYWMFRSADREILMIAGEVGGHRFSNRGWPIGQENLIRLDQGIDEAQLARLRTIKRIQYRCTTTIAVNYNIDKSELKRLQDELDLTVYSEAELR